MAVAAAPTQLPGPADRVHFADEQRRYRRKSWRFSVLAAFAAITTGIPACVVVTPLVYAVVLIGPIISFTWRTRRHLADAMAVQLTRQPDALVSALHALGVSAASKVKGADALAFLFVVWPTGTSGDGAVIGRFSRMHPKLHKRQQRLRLLGATNVSTARPRGQPWTPGRIVATLTLVLLVGPLSAIALGLSIVLVAMLTMLTLMMMMMMMVLLIAVWALFELLFIALPAWIAHR